MGIGNAKRHFAGPLVAPVALVALNVGLIAGLIVGLFVGLSASADARAAAPAAIDGVTYGQPKVVPAEFNGDLAKLPPLAFSKAGETPTVYRPRLQGPLSTKVLPPNAAQLAAPQFSGPLAPMPSPTQNFAGMSLNDICVGGTCGGGWPPDPNGDVGPNQYILAVNNAVAIYDKSGTKLASFTENNLWLGSGSNPCNGNSQGDPVVLYDWLADRFILTWFAFNNSGTGPFYQCIAASKTGDPVAGGWWLYPVLMSPGGPGLPPLGRDLNDYGKFGLWHDCLYMVANEFNGNAYDGVLFASFSRADFYIGAALTYGLGWLQPATNAFTLVPSNSQGTGTEAAQPGTPNYVVSTSGTSFAFEVRTFTPGPNCGGGGVLSAPTLVGLTSYTPQANNIVPQPNTGNTLDMIDDRVMQKVQYRNVGGAESLWVVHPVQNPSGSNTALQWAQIDVTGGTIATTPVQQQIHSPDNTLYRFMGSLAVDNQGNMALGYTTSNGTSPNFPSIKYAGRLSTDPLNTLPQTEVTMIAGSGSQKNNCGGAPCDRWGDYSSMSVDPADDCTFWYVNEYYSSQANGTSGNWQTRIGSFKFPSCTPRLPTTTVLGSSLNPSIVGNSVTLTATVSGTGATPTGNVVFTDGSAVIAGCGAVALDGAGVAQCPAGALSFGFHSILATYGGGPGNAGSHSARLLQAMNPVGGGYNVALAAYGGTASVSSTFSGLYPATSLNNNERAGSPWGAGGGWNDATLNAFPDTAQVLFGGGNKTIKTVVVYTLQDGYLGPIEPTDTMTFTKFGVRDFAVQGWNGSSWFN
ncbi:MAG: Ig-like domain repeat protein, partial [Aromatoleum sp.]|nr:Ig-like domain repeat protein [Aromatoleum sp.]